MEQWAKLLARVQASRRNTSPDELVRLMESLRFNAKRRGPGGHSVHFRHLDFPDVAASMATNADPVKVGYVDECLTAIEILFEKQEAAKEKEGK